MRPNFDLALEGAAIQSVSGDRYRVRQWQGIPGIECAPDNRLWAAFYSGGTGEGPGNYIALVKSEDRGQIVVGSALCDRSAGAGASF